jgi:hypothetical protein
MSGRYLPPSPGKVPRQSGPHALEGPRDHADRFKISGGGDRETGLDDVDIQAFELSGHAYFLFDVHAAPGRLLPVAERRVEHDDAVVHG